MIYYDFNFIWIKNSVFTSCHKIVNSNGSCDFMTKNSIKP